VWDKFLLEVTPYLKSPCALIVVLACSLSTINRSGPFEEEMFQFPNIADVLVLLAGHIDLDLPKSSVPDQYQENTSD
jgi:hypothetical protein